jgi:uncharacterized C2H2 Zn-finger protein
MNLSPENANKFFCEYCNYSCKKQSDYTKHLNTKKHKNKEIKFFDKEQTTDCQYKCKNCNKKYKARNSLWYHEKKCIYIESVPSESKIEKPDICQLLEQLIKTKKEDKEFICKCGKIYRHDSSYYRHKNKCLDTNKKINESNIEKDQKQDICELVKYLIKENSELKNIITQQNIVLNKIKI